MLRLTLDTSPEIVSEVQGRLERLSRQNLALDETEPVSALLAHGRLLCNLLPATDGILKALDATPGRDGQSAFRAAILVRQAASRTTARQFRILLYCVSLLLVALLAHVGWQLRARAQALHRRADFEHVIARISTRLISTQVQDLDRAIEQALGEMARCIGSERAYFLPSGPAARSFTWCEEGLTFPPGWPDRTRWLLPRCRPTVDGVVHIASVTRLSACADRDALVSAGLQGWTCVARAGANDLGSLLGFDAVTHPGRFKGDSEFGLLRMALDAIATALGRQTLEQERARLETRLQQAQRLETVGALASGIAHNFNNIVGAILGYTEMANERQMSDSRAVGLFEEIRKAAERARELVDQILTFSRRRDSNRSPLDLRTLIDDAASLLRASLPGMVDLVIQQSPAPIVVSGVPAQLQQVIMNLCNNAAQAMDGAGQIELDVTADNLWTPRSLSHGELPPGNYVRVVVTDGGRGIDEALIGRIFEPFFTTRITGNGLGLASTLDIVREHGGAIHVQSTTGVGSRFEVWLPLIAVAAVMPGGDATSPPSGRGETVLIIEDDGEQLLRTEEILAAVGYEPVGFARAADARNAFRATPTRFDAAVVGHLAPITAALELATSLHAIVPGLPILLAAPSAGEFSTNSLVCAGVSDVVPWPIIAGEIALALENSLRRRGGLLA
jgi:signal transduction histidine kinase